MEKSCEIIGSESLIFLLRKYLALVPEDLTDNEREILLFGLYKESLANGGMAADKRLR